VGGSGPDGLSTERGAKRKRTGKQKKKTTQTKKKKKIRDDVLRNFSNATQVRIIRSKKIQVGPAKREFMEKKKG